MKLERISIDKAEHIIVYGENKGFSMIEISDILLTIYHRIFENKCYDIAEMNVKLNEEDENEEPTKVFYILDHEEVKQMLK